MDKSSQDIEERWFVQLLYKKSLRKGGINMTIEYEQHKVNKWKKMKDELFLHIIKLSKFIDELQQTKNLNNERIERAISILKEDKRMLVNRYIEFTMIEITSKIVANEESEIDFRTRIEKGILDLREYTVEQECSKCHKIVDYLLDGLCINCYEVERSE